jgi:hypothetical protein
MALKYRHLLLFTSLAILRTLAQSSDDEEASGIPEMYDGLVLGLGQGTLAVCVMAIVGVFICFFRDIMAIPSIMIFIGFALPSITLIIVMSIPKRPLTVSKDEPTDNFHFQVFFCAFFSILFCCCQCLLFCGFNISTLFA